MTRQTIGRLTISVGFVSFSMFIARGDEKSRMLGFWAARSQLIAVDKLSSLPLCRKDPLTAAHASAPIRERLQPFSFNEI